MNMNPWLSSAVRTALEGHSFIDAKQININSLQEAEDFLLCYGFDIHDTQDYEELDNLRLEAIALIEEELLTADETIPIDSKNQKDIRQLLLIASGHGDRSQMPWCAALLRVIHTLVHSHSYLNDIYHDDIRQQIFERFDKHITHDNNLVKLGQITLVNVEFRKAKTRRSVAMKLLHKAENVAADIFDWIGIRFITHHRSDVLDIFAYLRQENIVTFANIKPSRSRNTLVDIDWLNTAIDSGKTMKNIRQEMQALDYPAESQRLTDNQFTENSYHSVQITCRQRIKIKQANGKRFSFYFPFEIQVMDSESFIKTREGRASHGEYKERQRASVRKRVLQID